MRDHLPTLVYGLCAVTSVICATLLLHGWRKTGQRLLVLVGVCFVVLVLNNLLLVVDRVLAPQIDMSLTRAVTGLAAVGGLLVALIWEAR